MTRAPPHVQLFPSSTRTCETAESGKVTFSARFLRTSNKRDARSHVLRPKSRTTCKRPAPNTKTKKGDESCSCSGNQHVFHSRRTHIHTCIHTFLVALEPRSNAAAAFRLPALVAVGAAARSAAPSLERVRWWRKDSSKTGNACLQVDIDIPCGKDQGQVRDSMTEREDASGQTTKSVHE